MKKYGFVMAGAMLLALVGCQSSGKQSAQKVDEENDRCMASEYQQYVGKPLTSIEKLRFSGPARAIPFNSPVTMDFNLNRINFMADSQGKITRVYCG